jgi:succinate-semialdehyde dehydrogenase / glutarate-semialdehyde dehydrogenase
MTQMAIRNPRSGVLDYHVSITSRDAIAARCAELRTAQTAWAAKPMAARVATLQSFKAALQQHREALTDALINDTGRRMISIVEVGGVLGMIDRWCAAAPALYETATHGDTQSAQPTISYGTALHPLGLVGVISPWNFPLTLSLIDTIPALLAGCAVTLKPSEVTPRFAAPLRTAIADVPILASVFAVFDGDGSSGAALVDHVDAICFTGSVATGRKVGEQCARNFIPAFLELGGKDPAIVLASADPVHAAKALLRGSVVNTGQACQSIERIYVARSIYDAFVAALVAEAEAAKLNADDIHHGHLGPLIFNKQADIIQAQLQDAYAKGARALTGGKVETHGGGLYCRPTILVDVTHDMAIMQEETFGPILPVMAFDTPEEAVQYANDSIFGLSGAVFAATIEEAERVGTQLKVGGVSLNDAALTSMIWEAEKSSFKLSGLGASRMGASGLLRFYRKQALLRQHGAPAPLSAFAEEMMP